MRRADIEHVGALTPVQQGMLFHVLREPDAALYVEQGVCTLDGPLDLDAFRAAWQRAIDRHAALRSAFFWRQLSQPLQVTYRSVAVPLSIVTGEDAADTELVERIMARHRDALRAIDRPPLMQLDLIACGTDRWSAIWSIHHLVHDAWSLEVILREVWSEYDACRRGASAALPPVRPFSDFVAWQKDRLERDEAAGVTDAARFWAATLAPARGQQGRDITSGVGSDLTSGVTSDVDPEVTPYGHIDVRLSPDESMRIAAALRHASLTLTTAVLGAWTLVLARRGGTRGALFGVTVLGRPADLDGSERMVGVFINTLPCWVPLEDRRPVRDWLRDVQVRQQRIAPYEQSALSDIRAWCGWPVTFDTIVVIQHVFHSPDGQSIGGLRIGALETRGQPNYPLMLRVTPGERLRIELVYDRRRVHDVIAADLLSQVERSIDSIAARISDDVPTVNARANARVNARANARRESMPEAPRTAAPKLKGVSPKLRTVRAEEMITQDVQSQGGTRVCVLTANRPGMEARDWAVGARDLLTASLRETGAVLLRGFRPLADEEFHNFVAAAFGPPLEYRERSSPRTRVAGQVYTSTEYPSHQPIFLHNENSYADAWPMKIAFYGAAAADTGGATPIADVRAVYRQIPSEVRERFAETGVLYVRHFTQNVGLSWEDVYQTTDRGEVEAYCAAHGYTCEWLEDGLRTSRRGQAVAHHPITGDAVWFNHAAFFHLSTLEADVRAGLLAQFGESRLPNQTYYGDGRPIEPDVLDLIRQAYRDHQLSWPWRVGDLLLLDNMLVAHGREAFTGSRRVLVGMADRFDYRQLAAAGVGVGVRPGDRVHD